jgi:chaperone modulatory protein CbpM
MKAPDQVVPDQAALDRFAIEFGVTVTDLTMWIEQRWVLPARSGPDISFDDADRARVRMVIAFRRDLAIDNESMPVVLGLIDRLYATRARLQDVLLALADLPEPQRAALIRRLQEKTI